jgi:CCR4-NOT transcription complex subunit 2
MSSSSTGYPSLYHSNPQQHLTMGSLHNVPRALPGNLHSQGLQGRVTPTQLGNRPVSMQGMNFMPNSSTQASASNRNSLFNRKIGDGSAHFDPSDFPSLAVPGVGSSLAGVPRTNYVGMVKQPAEHSEFQMSSEDFPALPGAPPSVDGVNSGSIMDSLKMAPMTPEQELKHQQQQRKGIQTGPDGMVTNIPATMVTDQFGMIGLLTFIRAAETDPNLVSLALGTDLTTLGLNLNSDVDLFPTFGGPWADTPCRPQDIDFHVPHEYLTNTTIRDKLAPVKLNRYKDDILFFLFYTNVGDVLQLAAAAELHNRDWRYHKEEQLWITRAHGMVPTEKTQTYERGTYYFFDVASWRKVPKEFHLDYDKLEERPSLPASGPSPGPSGGSPGPGLGPQQQGL